jgi:hypothetical protein
MSSHDHEPRAACVEFGVPNGWIGTCSRGCCKGGRVGSAAQALADARLLIEDREVSAQLERSDAFWQKHTRTEATS